MNDRATSAHQTDAGAATSADGPRTAYEARIAAGRLERDPDQAAAVERLQWLHDALAGYTPAGRRGLIARWFGAGDDDRAPRGIYLVGSVGRGKSMLMDLFFAAAPVAAKRRVHFNAFMQEVHDRLHAWRRHHRGDPVPAAADAIAAEAALLCFDEFQVTNIADAMLLRRLFEGLFERGVVMVATSNTAPDRLYEGGLQRERFLPFIDILKARLDTVDLGDGTDWRRIRVAGQQVFFVPHDETARAAMAAMFRLLTDGADARPATIEFKGRSIGIARAAEGVAWCRFGELCERPLGAGDYLALAGAYHTLLLENVPIMTDDDRNEAQRFVALIDALYEHKTLLVMSAAAAPDALCRARDVAFAYRRTASRLVEMQTAEYRARHHRR